MGLVHQAVSISLGVTFCQVSKMVKNQHSVKNWNWTQRKSKILRKWNIPSEVRGINDLNHLEVGLFAEEYVVELVLDDPIVRRAQIGDIFEASFDGRDEGRFHAFRNVQFELFGKEIFETIFKLHIEPHKCIPDERNKMKLDEIWFFSY